MVGLRLILTRVRFRASRFGQVAKTISRSCESKQASCAEMGSGQLFFCSCDSEIRFLDSESSRQRRLLPHLAPRRVHSAPPWTQASKPALTDSSPAAKRRAEALHVVFFLSILFGHSFFEHVPLHFSVSEKYSTYNLLPKQKVEH